MENVADRRSRWIESVENVEALMNEKGSFGFQRHLKRNHSGKSRPGNVHDRFSPFSLFFWGGGGISILKFFFVCVKSNPVKAKYQQLKTWTANEDLDMFLIEISIFKNRKYQ